MVNVWGPDRCQRCGNILHGDDICQNCGMVRGEE